MKTEYPEFRGGDLYSHKRTKDLYVIAHFVKLRTGPRRKWWQFWKPKNPWADGVIYHRPGDWPHLYARTLEDFRQHFDGYDLKTVFS